MGGCSAAQAIIGAMIPPALLILASGSLIDTALVRLARVVDRARKLGEPGAAKTSAGEVHRHARHALLAERALQCFLFAVVCFVVAGAAIGADHLAADRLTWIPVAMTLLGKGLLVAGSAATLSKCRLAVAQISAATTRLTMALGGMDSRHGRALTGLKATRLRRQVAWHCEHVWSASRDKN